MRLIRPDDQGGAETVDGILTVAIAQRPEVQPRAIPVSVQ
jgi:hypothetical protein